VLTILLKGETSIRCDHNQNPAVCKVTKINYNEKTTKKERLASWFSRYFGQSSRPSSGDSNPPKKKSPEEGRLDRPKYRENQLARRSFFDVFSL